MSVRFKKICVSNGKVYDILKKEVEGNHIHRKELAGKTVLSVDFTWETKNRKPFRVLYVQFSRMTFDQEGVYAFSVEKAMPELGRALEYAFHEIVDDGTPLPIPEAPVIPTKEEKNQITEYLHKKCPDLMKSNPYLIGSALLVNEGFYRRNLRMMKESHEVKSNSSYEF